MANKGKAKSGNGALTDVDSVDGALTDVTDVDDVRTRIRRRIRNTPLASNEKISFDAKGGPLVTAGFLLSGAIVALAMIAGIRAARTGDWGSHARAMRHVVHQNQALYHYPRTRGAGL